jgi:hypothetical protein
MRAVLPLVDSIVDAVAMRSARMIRPLQDVVVSAGT